MPKAKPKPTVDELLAEHPNPLKPEIEAVRQLIKTSHPGITEQWKWNAPSFSYKGQYLLTFNLWENSHIHLVWHNPHIINIQSPLLEGDYPTRRMTHIADITDIEAKRTGLQTALQQLIALIDQ